MIPNGICTVLHCTINHHATWLYTWAAVEFPSHCYSVIEGFWEQPDTMSIEPAVEVVLPDCVTIKVAFKHLCRMAFELYNKPVT